MTHSSQGVGNRESRRCPRCSSPGRLVQLITIRSLLTARALERLTLEQYRFCGTPSCELVYFSEQTCFGRDDVRVPVFQKEPPGCRMVCYCFEVVEKDADAATETCIRAHVRAGRCACELRNPTGRCCLTNFWAVLHPTPEEVSRDG